jgi:flagellar protein FlaG
MDTKVAAFAATPDPTSGQRPVPPKPVQGAPAEPVATGPDPGDLRLVIEEDKASGSYVYKTIDRLTGEVVQQLPRDEVLKLKDQAEYEAGNVVRTKA